LGGGELNGSSGAAVVVAFFLAAVVDLLGVVVFLAVRASGSFFVDIFERRTTKRKPIKPI
jgi:hypothetical protein